MEHQIDVVRLLKVDTEGYEKYVFLGGRTMLSKTDVVIFEAIQDNCQRFHYHLGEIIEFLEDLNFHVYCFNTDAGSFEEVNIEHYISNSGSYLYDLFAVKDPSLIKGVRWC